MLKHFLCNNHKLFVVKHILHFLTFRLPTCKGQPGLSGERLNKPRKIVLMFLFGFEADVLEIALKQQHDLVDKIFLVESSSSHRGVSLSPYFIILKILQIFSDKQNADVGKTEVF